MITGYLVILGIIVLGMILESKGMTGRRRVPVEEGASLILPVPGCSGGTLNIATAGTTGNLFGATPVSTGDAAFDQDFVVHAAPRKFARRLFDPSRRAGTVAIIRRLSRHGDVSVRIRVGEVEVRVDPKAPSRLLRDGARDLAELLMKSLMTVPVAPLTGLCPVCATPLSEPVWRCDRCRVPQHRECRDYVGRCAIYACEPARRSA